MCVKNTSFRFYLLFSQFILLQTKIIRKSRKKLFTFFKFRVFYIVEDVMNLMVYAIFHKR